ncbi:PREDICTED: latent-transforming growth factor beta-binding protein 1-like [Cyprinodon variegatus]|uniref:latent-transforming growth factor beta-binding protein 1-like n=1 Tax=Cyprinodon variegatus TaxID=28743 RepID=UPI0007427AA3|nr:PREDICTED: latent-transforming growth factor beta-binding protein 1-like [Cyprinodon variegatus]
MRAKSALLILALISTVKSETECGVGFSLSEDGCVDDDECAHPRPVCGPTANCFNTHGSFYCQCKEGVRSPYEAVNLTFQQSAKCQDINECIDKDLCGPNTECINTIPNYYCTCNQGFQSSTEASRSTQDTGESHI